MGDPAATTDPAWREFARAPLVPVALAAALGLVIDRYLLPPLGAELLVAVGALIAWGVSRRAAWLWLAAAGVAAAHHQTHRTTFAADDVATFATAHPTPARVRGTLDEEPARYRPWTRNRHDTARRAPTRLRGAPDRRARPQHSR